MRNQYQVSLMLILLFGYRLYLLNKGKIHFRIFLTLWLFSEVKQFTDELTCINE